MMKLKPKLIVVLGPTSSGKSDLAVFLAKKLDGEVVSADSRQVYKGMDIGTGKITKKEMGGIPHHLLDVASPKRKFSVSQYKRKADKIIKEIQKRNKIPILCGGTGFYIQAVVDGLVIPPVKPDWKLRKKLEKQSCQDLFKKLKEIDPKRAEIIDKHNKRRLVRAIEIVLKTKKPVPRLVKKQNFDVLMLGITRDKAVLQELIKKRLSKRFKQGMVAEVRKLKKSGLSWKRLEDFGLEYRFIAYYLQGKMQYKEMVEWLQKEHQHYAQRQMTWFKRDKRIYWIKDKSEAQKLAKKFLER